MKVSKSNTLLVSVGLVTWALSNSVNAAWTVTSDTDPMTNKAQYYAMSPSVQSIKPMDFPYKGTKSWIGVGCDSSGSKWVYFGFSSQPNMTDDKTQSGYSTANRRIKWDDTMSTVYMTQDWGSKFVHVGGQWDDKVIDKLKLHSSVMLDMSAWSGSKAYFQYSLSGSTKAINQILSKCGVSKSTKAVTVVKLEPKLTGDACTDIKAALKNEGVTANQNYSKEVMALFHASKINATELSVLKPLADDCGK